MKNLSALGKIYQSSYEKIAGAHPNQRMWHFQWLAICDLHKELKNISPLVRGMVLDVGCGSKPYKGWFSKVSEYIGIDIYQDVNVDFVVDPDDRFPFDENMFDTILAFEVFEHVEKLEHTTNEIVRVLKPGGRIIVSMPFLYTEHGAPNDYRRLTKFSTNLLFQQLVKLESIKTIGGVGSTTSVIILNWMDAMANINKFTRLIKGLLLPAWVLISLITNVFGKILDLVDKTDICYHHVLMIYQKEK